MDFVGWGLNYGRYFFSDLFLPLQVHTMMPAYSSSRFSSLSQVGQSGWNVELRDVDDDDGDLLFSGHAYVDSDKTSTQAHNFYILIPLRKILLLANAYVRFSLNIKKEEA